MFKALGDETRLRIVALLSHGELCVCHIEEALGLLQPSVSRHLATLRNAGLVESRRKANWVYYRLARQPDEPCCRHLDGLVADYRRRDALLADVERIVKRRRPAADPQS